MDEDSIEDNIMKKVITNLKCSFTSNY